MYLLPTASKRPSFAARIERYAWSLCGFLVVIFLWFACLGDWRRTTLAASLLSGSSTTTSLNGQVLNPAAINSADFFASLEHVFVFGDSFSDTHFSFYGEQPTADQPLGNSDVQGLGYGRVALPNWVNYLTNTFNQSAFLTFNLASTGATIDRAVTPPPNLYIEPVPFSDQIENFYRPHYAHRPEDADWKTDTTLFAIFVGANEYAQATPGTAPPLAQLMASYHGMVEELYESGARNFLIMNLPPIDRVAAASAFVDANAVAAFNQRLAAMRDDFEFDHPDVNTFFFDISSLWTRVLAKPDDFTQTAHLHVTSATCTAYAEATVHMNSSSTACVAPMNQYFWLDVMQATPAVHEATAALVAQDCFTLGFKRGFCS